MQSVILSQIWIYPVKSMAGISLDSVNLLAKGLQYDRQWMLVDQDNHFLSQRQHPQMSQIKVSLVDTGLKLHYKDLPALVVPWFDPKQNYEDRIRVKIWQDNCEAIHLNRQFDQWFQQILNIPCKLVFMPEESQRAVDPAYAKNREQTRFSDGFPLLLISEASLADLNRRLPAPVSMQRFRPNLVVSGCDAYAEDNWQTFQIGDILFQVVKPCSRCIITTIDPQTGKRNSQEPLQTLMQYRKKDNKVFFGQNILFEAAGDDAILNTTLRVNTPLVAIKTRQPE